MANPKKKGLGKGLGALIGGTTLSGGEDPGAKRPSAPAGGEIEGARLIELDPRDIRPNPKQPRHTFDEESLLELADSIRRDGVQEPVIVRQKNGQYELVSGERRVRASILADRVTIPCIVRDVSDRDMLKLGLIENIQREDLNPIELAKGYQALIKEFNWTQENLAEQVGKKRVTVTNTLRLLNLPKDVQDHLISGAITMGHARALLAFDSPEKQSMVCRTIIKKGLSVRQVEQMTAPKQPKARKAQPRSDPHVAQVEDDLRRRLGARVRLHVGANNRGRIEIEFYDLEDLERICRLLQK